MDAPGEAIGAPVRISGDQAYRCYALLYRRGAHAAGPPATPRRPILAPTGVVGTGHWLRYTFAMMMLVRLQVQARTTPEINPLKVVQVLWGHSSIASTAIFCAVSKCSGPSWRSASPIFTAR